MRFLYNTIAGSFSVDIEQDFAKLTGLEDKKLFTGDNLDGKVRAWVDKHMGGFNYRIVNQTICRLDTGSIEKNLYRYKKHAAMSLHMSQRLAGEYDVLHRHVSDPYAQSEYDVIKDDVSYTTKGSNGEVVMKEVGEHFKEQGYFKIWCPREGQAPAKPGLAPVPVYDVYYVTA